MKLHVTVTSRYALASFKAFFTCSLSAAFSPSTYPVVDVSSTLSFSSFTALVRFVAALSYTGASPDTPSTPSNCPASALYAIVARYGKIDLISKVCVSVSVVFCSSSFASASVSLCAVASDCDCVFAVI